ncbi:unnamed protein product [Diplocarpon coronariae]
MHYGEGAWDHLQHSKRQLDGAGGRIRIGFRVTGLQFEDNTQANSRLSIFIAFRLNAKSVAGIRNYNKNNKNNNNKNCSSRLESERGL